MRNYPRAEMSNSVWDANQWAHPRPINRSAAGEGCVYVSSRRSLLSFRFFYGRITRSSLNINIATFSFAAQFFFSLSVSVSSNLALNLFSFFLCVCNCFCFVYVCVCLFCCVCEWLCSIEQASIERNSILTTFAHRMS